MQEATEILERIRARMPRDRATLLDYHLVGEIEEQITALDPFRILAAGWVRNGAGGMIASRVLGNWVIDRLRQGVPSVQIVDELLQALKQNRAVYMDVNELAGISVEAPVIVGPGATIVPRAQIPQSARLRMPDRQPSATSAALIQEYAIAPAIIERRDEELLERLDGPSRLEMYARWEFAQQLLRALLLTTTGPVQLRFVASGLPAPGQDLWAPVGAYAGDNHSWLKPVAQPAAETIRTILALVREFNEPEVLNLAIDRLATSRLGGRGVDKAIDLGMAAEIALMKGDSDSKSEIGYKLRLRGALVLGGTLEARRSSLEILGLLYRARSEAAHTGVLGKKLSQKYDFETANKLVTRVLVKLLENGDFPNWDDLALGANL